MLSSAVRRKRHGKPKFPEPQLTQPRLQGVAVNVVQLRINPGRRGLTQWKAPTVYAVILKFFLALSRFPNGCECYLILFCETIPGDVPVNTETVV